MSTSRKLEEHGLDGRAVLRQCFESLVTRMSDRADAAQLDLVSHPSGSGAPGVQSRFRFGECRASGGMTRTSPQQSAHYSVAHADAVVWLKSLETGSVDLIVTDPAYESLEKHRARGTTTRLKRSKASSNDWFTVFPNARFPELFSEAYRVLKNHRHFYLFCDQETMFVVKPLAEAAGFRFWKPLIWDKRRIGMGYHYRSRYELILFFEKGKRKLADLSVPDIIEHPRIHRGYPAEKPSAVSSVLIGQSSEAGELVIDPFSGSGSVGLASLKLGRRFAGCDICEQAVIVSTARLAEFSAGEAGARTRP